MQTLPFRDDALVLIMPLDHPLAASPVSFIDSLQHDYVGLAAHSALSVYLEEQALHAGFRLQTRIRAEGFDGVIRMVARGAGLGIVPQAAAQVLGHLTKVTYFAMVIEGPAGRDPEQWLVMGYAACFAILGTTLSRSFLDRMSDRQFYHWTRRVILWLGAVYVAQGVWLMATR